MREIKSTVKDTVGTEQVNSVVEVCASAPPVTAQHFGNTADNDNVYYLRYNKREYY